MSTIPYTLMSDIPDALLQHYLQQSVIAVDTELHGLTLYRDQVCLVQLCDESGQVCLVKPQAECFPHNLKILMESSHVIKVFHFALTDVSFFKTSLGITVSPFRCTKVMSKLTRTYTGEHGLRHLCKELLGITLEKEQQQTNWASSDLSPQQLEYAANDVLYLVKIYRILEEMIEARGTVGEGETLLSLHEKAQAILPNLVDLLIHRYGDTDRGWKTSLFEH